MTRPRTTQRTYAAAAALVAFVCGVLLATPAAALASAGLANSAAATGAAIDCDRTVVDAAGVLSPAELGSVTDRADKLRTDTALEIRVRILTQEQAPVLDSWVDLAQENCASWHGADGGFRTNLIVLAVTTDTSQQTGETGLYAGDAVPAALDDSEIQRIQADVINPALSDGDYERGIIAGLDAIDDAINPGFPVGVLIFLVLLALAVIVVIVVVVVRRRRAAQVRRTALTERLNAATSASDALVLQMDEVAERLDLDLALVPSVLAPEEAAQLTGTTTAVRERYAAVTTTRGDLTVGRDLVYHEDDAAKVTAIAEAWEKLQKDSAEVLPQLVAEETRLSTALTKAQAVPSRVSAIQQKEAQVRALEASARSQGFVVDGDVAALATVPEVLDRVRGLVAQRQLLAAAEALDELDAALQASEDALGSLAGRVVELQKRLTSLRAERTALDALAVSAAAAETQLHTAFPGVARAEDQSVESARATLPGVDSDLAAAATALTGRDLAAADTDLDRAAATLSSARTTFESAGARLAAAQKLSTELPARLDRDRRVLEQVEAQRRTLTDGGAAYGPALDAVRATLAAATPGAAPDWVHMDADLTAAEAQLEDVRRGIEQAVQAHQAAIEDMRMRSGPGVVVVGGGRGGGWFGGPPRRGMGVGIRVGRSFGRSSFGRSSGGRSFGGRSSGGGGGRRGGSSGRSSGGRRGGSARR